MGDRTFLQFDTLTIKDERNGLFSEILFNPEKKSKLSSLFGSSKKGPGEERADYFEGVISMNEGIDYKKNRGKLK